MNRFSLAVLLGGIVCLAPIWGEAVPPYSYATLEAEGFLYQKEAYGAATLTLPNENHDPENDLMILVTQEPSVEDWNIGRLRTLGNTFVGSDIVKAWKWEPLVVETDYPYPDLSLVGKGPGIGGRAGNAMIVDVNVVVPPGTTKVTAGSDFLTKSSTPAVVILIVGTQAAYDHWNEALDTLFASIESN